MRIVLAVTMHNEIDYGPHVWIQMDHALEMDYDDIVVLDDCSTDGTYDVLKEYESKYKNIHVFRNNENSILNKGEKRWKTLTDHCAKFKPDWINYRAADQIYCPALKNNFRKVMEWFHNKRCDIINIPLIHLWRCETWYRIDRVWGNDFRNHTKFQLWRFNPKYKYNVTTAKLHQGGHLPHVRKRRDVCLPINLYNGIKSPHLKEDDPPWPFVIFHLGHTTHEKKETKFRWTVQASINSVGMPSKIPSPENWLKFNGYKGFYEFDIDLKPVEEVWYDGNPPKIEQKPEVKPFTKVISEFDNKIAKKYEKLYIEKIKPDSIIAGVPKPGASNKKYKLFPKEGIKKLIKSENRPHKPKR